MDNQKYKQLLTEITDGYGCISLVDQAYAHDPTEFVEIARQFVDIAKDPHMHMDMVTLTLGRAYKKCPMESRSEKNALRVRLQKAFVLTRSGEVISSTPLKLCRFCARSANTRLPQRPIIYCRDHDQTNPVTNATYAAAYRNTRFSYPAELTRTQELVPEGTIAFITKRLLKRFLAALHKGGGSGAYSVVSVLTMLDKNATATEEHVLSQVRMQAIPGIERLTEADYGTGYTNASLQFRKAIGDAVGVEQLSANNVTVPPYQFVSQWLAYLAWRTAGDGGARPKKGRRATIDANTALKMRDTHTHSEIAKAIGCSQPAISRLFKRIDSEGNF